MRTLIRDERGASHILQLVTILIAPVVVLMLASAMISAIRTGAGVTEALTRNAQAQVMFTEFQSTVAAATTASVTGPGTVTLHIDPAQLPPGIALDADQFGDACVTHTWALTDGGGLRTLTHKTQVHQGTCASPVRSTGTQEFTGLSAGTAFTFENSAGRTLTLNGGVLTPAAEGAPTGVSPAAWASKTLGAVVLSGSVQEMLADRPTTVTAVTAP